jgi:hypothetical protein
MRFGELELVLPPGWSDQSVLTFVRAPDAPSRMPELQKNLVLVRAPADGSFTVQELAEKHLASLKAAVPKIEVVKESPLTIDGAPALMREVRFGTPAHGLAQQLHVFVIKGDLAFTMVGTASAGLVFEAFRPELMGLVSSFKRWA